MNKDLENDSNWINWDSTVEMPKQPPQQPQQPPQRYPMPDPYATSVTGDQIHPMAEYEQSPRPVNPFVNTPPAPQDLFEVYPQPERPFTQNPHETYQQQEQPVQQNFSDVHPQPEKPFDPFEEYIQPEQPASRKPSETYPQPEQDPFQYPYGLNRPQDKSGYVNPFDEYAPKYTEEEITVPFDEAQQPEMNTGFLQQDAVPVQPNPNGPVFNQPVENGSPIPTADESAQPGADSLQQNPEEPAFSQPDESESPIPPAADFGQTGSDSVQQNQNGPVFNQFDENENPIPTAANPGQPGADSVQQNPNGPVFNQFDENGNPIPPAANPGQPDADSVQQNPNGPVFNQFDENGNPIPPAQPYGNFQPPYPGGVPYLSKKEIKARRKALKKQKKAGKGNKGKIIVFSVLAVIIAIAIAGYFALFHDPDASAVKGGSTTESPSATVTDASGNTYAAVVDTNGVTYAAVRDSEGHLWQVNINPDGSFGDAVGSLDGVLDSTTAATSGINETANADAYTGAAQDVATTTASSDTSTTTAAASDNSASTTAAASDNSAATTAAASSDTTASGDNSASTTASDKKSSKSSDATTATDSSSGDTEFNLIRYQEMFASGNYYMEFTTNDEDLGDGTIVSAGKDGNLYFNTSLEGINASILYLASEDKSYIIIPEMERYCSLPKKLLGEEVDMKDMNVASGMFSDKMTSDVLSSKEVEINGQTLTCEYCETTSGAKYEYYFDNGTLVRCDITSTDGTVSEMYFSKITTEVDDSLFTIPDGYGYLNLSWLG